MSTASEERIRVAVRVRPFISFSFFYSFKKSISLAKIQCIGTQMFE